MKSSTLIWTIIFVLGAIGLIVNAAMRGAGSAYVKAVPLEFVNVAEAGEDPEWIRIDSPEALDYNLADYPEEERIAWTRYAPSTPLEHAKATAEDPNQTEYHFSLPRTMGIWVAAFFTLCIFSFLYRDNPFYKLAESCVIGVSAAYWMVVAFHEVLIPNLLGKIWPAWVRSWAIPGLEGSADYVFIIPLILSVLLLWRLAPKGAWIARWPLAFVIGTTAGIRLVGFIHADFLSQIRNSIVPLYVVDGVGGVSSTDPFWDSIKNVILLVGVLTALVYFFFSIEHKGAVGKVARVGIWFLMITFGAAFGYTVMGRIALLAIRLEFLVDDWLWLIDPTGKHTVDAVAMIVTQLVPMVGL